MSVSYEVCCGAFRFGSCKRVAMTLLRLHRQELVFWASLWRGRQARMTGAREGERENEAENENRFLL